MPKKRIPSYRHHRGSGQAVVVFDGRSVYLGVWNSPESHEKYRRVIAEWLTQNRQPTPPSTVCANSITNTITVNELILRYVRFAETYDPPVGETTSEIRCIREALRPARQLYGTALAGSFGPLCLKAVRQAMIDKGWCRTHINHQVNRVRRLFRWGVSEELIPSSVYEALRSVAGLTQGRHGVRESQPVEPAFWEHIQAIKPFCPRKGTKGSG
jgi:hypothetical protein